MHIELGLKHQRGFIRLRRYRGMIIFSFLSLLLVASSEGQNITVMVHITEAKKVAGPVGGSRGGGGGTIHIGAITKTGGAGGGGTIHAH